MILMRFEAAALKTCNAALVSEFFLWECRDTGYLIGKDVNSGKTRHASHVSEWCQSVSDVVVVSDHQMVGQLWTHGTQLVHCTALAFNFFYGGGRNH